ncbi:BAX inhibitor (BI)-1/YccA family protein [Pseudoduganella sp. FT25W]|jgi:FtsH-binding integral membrane protein|uniref:BAX inhibitor (BI)-1/YccA family protein n=1 Tax=Duganella alba TaxID=2666081 RepID=A0A6L5QCL9_9BURK|nr:Bax inhibitor-1/YccA family protein [Duganella alba]MRX07497.1 BAX inhibitor (BI)-1/YccA family protein [Duganella alba]MRX15882.1 BAX inhibitor (BI)-1/YccA family protein [Duganella alba]
MNNMQNTYDLSGSRQAVQHRVLRNTYWLLALSMVPTVFGAVLGVALHLPLHGGLMALAFLAIAFGFIWGIEKNKDSGVGVALLLGFTFFMGLWLTPLLSRILGFSNGGFLIMTAFGGTAAVFAVLASVATVSKRDFSGMGTWLFAGVIILLLASVANIFLNIPALAIVVSVVAIAIFSAYILYDVQQIINGGETNYIRATLSLYLDVYNIFANLLSLLGIFGGNRD